MCWPVWFYEKLLKKKHVVLGNDNNDQFRKQVEFFGSGSFEFWCDQNKVVINTSVRDLLRANARKSGPVWEEMISSDNIGLFDRDGFDLLSQMFRMNPVVLLG